MKFLKLTTASSKKLTRINFANVNSYSKNPDGDGTIIYYVWGSVSSSNNRPTIQLVMESPDEIDKMLGIINPGSQSEIINEPISSD